VDHGECSVVPPVLACDKTGFSLDEGVELVLLAGLYPAKQSLTRIGVRFLHLRFKKPKIIAQGAPRCQHPRYETQKGNPKMQPPLTPVRLQPGLIQQQQPPGTVYISFSAEIVPNTTETLIATASNFANQGVKQLYLMLSTPGGSVMHGMTLYNVLRALPVELITHNVGNVDSIGNAIFLAGSKRYACPHSTFMFHGVGCPTQPNQLMEAKFLRERLDNITADQKRIGSVIGERTKISEDDVANLFLEAQTKYAAFALANGIVDEIREVNVPPGNPVVALVFQR